MFNITAGHVDEREDTDKGRGKCDETEGSKPFSHVPNPGALGQQTDLLTHWQWGRK